MDLFFIGALPALFGGISASNEPHVAGKLLDKIKEDINSLVCGPARDGYKRGPKVGIYRIDDKGRKRYD